MPVANYITLSELTSQIKTAIANVFASKTYWVVADITDHKFYPAKGTHYFSLAEKDPVTHTLSSKITAVAWSDGGAVSIASFQRITGQQFKSDIHVLVNVSVSYHQLYGLQLVLNDIDTTFTIGQLEQQRQETINKLLHDYPESIRKVGDRFITTNNQLRIARVIQNVAVVTASGAAGYIDFKNTLEDNKYGYKIYLTNYFTTVQGENNSAELCQRMLDIYQSGIAYDAVVIIRGGGSQTDFLLFNQFNVARIVAKFPIPVIAGIGHQINETIVDLMAHTSVKTPSIAAETIITHNRMFEDEMLNMQQGIIIKSQQMFNARQNELSQLNSTLINKCRSIIQQYKDSVARSSHVVINQTKTIIYRYKNELSDASVKLTTRPIIIVGHKQGELTNIIENMQSYSRKYFANMKGYLGHYDSVIKLVSPVNTLKRGFAIVYKDDKIIVDTNKLNQGDKVRVRLADADIAATITNKTKTNGLKL